MPDDTPVPSTPQQPPVIDSANGSKRLEWALIMMGFLFCTASAISIGYAVYQILFAGLKRQTAADGREWRSQFLTANADLLLVMILAVISALIGLSFFKHAGRSTNYVIRPEDRKHIWPLIADEKVGSIDQYIRLASLSGFSGAFTKVGFTGLPLATVGLTLGFVTFALIFANDDLMELAKLTLGAFIGSFVQRQVERGERQVGGTGSVNPAASAPRLPV